METIIEWLNDNPKEAEFISWVLISAVLLIVGCLIDSYLFKKERKNLLKDNAYVKTIGNLVPEYVPYKTKQGGRVWIGGICIADVYTRILEKKEIMYEFHIRGWLKDQPDGQWLEYKEVSEYIKKANSIEEGMRWINNKLNEK